MSEPNQTVQPDEMGEQQLSELLQIRRDKLQALREAGQGSLYRHPVGADRSRPGDRGAF